MMLEFDWAQADDRTGTLSLRARKSKDEQTPSPATEAVTAEEHAKAIKQSRAKYQQMKPMLAMVMGGMKHEVLFHLPGRKGESNAFQEEGSGRLRLSFDGAKMIEGLERFINDDAWVAENSDLLNPQATQLSDEQMSELLFGETGPVRATVTTR